MAKRTKLTDEILKEIRFHIKRTGVGPSKVLHGRRSEMPEGLNSTTICNWFRRDIKSALTDHLEYIQSLWRSLPDADAYEQADDLSSFQDIKSLIPIPEKILVEMEYHAERTKQNASMLLKGRPIDAPKGLSSDIVRNWFTNTKSARADHLNYVLERWRAQPDAIEITSEMREALDNEIERTGLNVTRFLNIKRPLLPETLTDKEINQWRKRQKYVRADHYQQVIRAWRELPDKNSAFSKYDTSDAHALKNPPKKSITASNLKAGRIEITQAMLKELESERERVGINTMEFLKHVAARKPAFFSETAITHWLSGSTKTAEKSHWEFVMSEYRAMKPIRLTIDEALIEELKDFRALTGVYETELLEKQTDVPKGLTIEIVRSWINGNIKTAKIEHIEYVRAKWREHAE